MRIFFVVEKNVVVARKKGFLRMFILHVGLAKVGQI